MQPSYCWNGEAGISCGQVFWKTCVWTSSNTLPLLPQNKRTPPPTQKKTNHTNTHTKREKFKCKNHGNKKLSLCKKRTEGKFGVRSINSIYSNLIRGDEVISVTFMNVNEESLYKEESMQSQILGPRCFKDLFPYLFDAACQQNAPRVALRVS